VGFRLKAPSTTLELPGKISPVAGRFGVLFNVMVAVGLESMALLDIGVGQAGADVLEAVTV
jgi:hypothetical protein